MPFILVFAAELSQVRFQILHHPVSSLKDLSPPGREPLFDSPYFCPVADLLCAANPHDFDAVAPLEFSNARENVVHSDI